MARAGMRSVLESAGYLVRADVATGERLTADELGAGVIVVGIGHEAGGVVAALRADAPSARLLVLAGPDADVAAAVRDGADGILASHAEAVAVLAAIDDLVAGRAVLDPELAFRALRTRDDAIPDPDPLTPRELEVLRLLSRGQTNPQIASRLMLAVGTVKVHVEHILSKLGAADRTDAAVRAFGRGLLDDVRD